MKQASVRGSSEYGQGMHLDWKPAREAFCFLVCASPLLWPNESCDALGILFGAAKHEFTLSRESLCPKQPIEIQSVLAAS